VTEVTRKSSAFLSAVFPTLKVQTRTKDLRSWQGTLQSSQPQPISPGTDEQIAKYVLFYNARFVEVPRGCEMLGRDQVKANPRRSAGLELVGAGLWQQRNPPTERQPAHGEANVCDPVLAAPGNREGRERVRLAMAWFAKEQAQCPPRTSCTEGNPNRPAGVAGAGQSADGKLLRTTEQVIIESSPQHV
jgi:hypothetical protein